MVKVVKLVNEKLKVNGESSETSERGVAIHHFHLFHLEKVWGRELFTFLCSRREGIGFGGSFKFPLGSPTNPTSKLNRRLIDF
jgi:hypothetical protein